MQDETYTCVDCGGSAEWIKIVDATHQAGAEASEKSSGGGHIQLQYTAEDAQRSAWIKRFPTAGHLRGRMCTQCGRVVLYAVPKGV